MIVYSQVWSHQAKALSFLKVFFKGELIGGCDILLQMHQSGDLVCSYRNFFLYKFDFSKDSFTLVKLAALLSEKTTVAVIALVPWSGATTNDQTTQYVSGGGGRLETENWACYTLLYL